VETLEMKNEEPSVASSLMKTVQQPRSEQREPSAANRGLPSSRKELSNEEQSVAECDLPQKLYENIFKKKAM
jgi:hypothetical protein